MSIRHKSVFVALIGPFIKHEYRFFVKRKSDCEVLIKKETMASNNTHRFSIHKLEPHFFVSK